MKSRKYLYLALTAVAFSAMFAACSSKGNTPEDKTTKKCWEVTTKYLNEGTTEVAYYWETSTEVQERVKVLNMWDQVSASYKEASADDENSCKELNK